MFKPLSLQDQIALETEIEVVLSRYYPKRRKYGATTATQFFVELLNKPDKEVLDSLKGLGCFNASDGKI